MEILKLIGIFVVFFCVGRCVMDYFIYPHIKKIKEYFEKE